MIFHSRFSSSWCTKDAALDKTSKGVSILGKILIMEKQQILKSKPQPELVSVLNVTVAFSLNLVCFLRLYRVMFSQEFPE